MQCVNAVTGMGVGCYRSTKRGTEASPWGKWREAGRKERVFGVSGRNVCG